VEGPGIGRLSGRADCSSTGLAHGSWEPEWCMGDSAEAEAACPAHPARDGCPYIDDVFAAEAAAAIRAHAAEGAGAGPFMLVFAAHAVHAPLQVRCIS
jgi:hypothetical protein